MNKLLDPPSSAQPALEPHAPSPAVSATPEAPAASVVPVAAPDAGAYHRLYQLQTPGALKPAVTLGLGLPGQVNGLPAFYYWKDAIFVGTYHHPAKRFSLSVTRDKLDALVAAFGRMRANGVKVPILMDHAPTAAAALGWIVDVKRRGDRLLELHQFLGEAARDVGLRNEVSLGIDPAFVDGHGRSYGEAIVHSAVTPLPVVPGQEGFEPVESAEQTLTLSLADQGNIGGESENLTPSPGTPGEGGGEGDLERTNPLDAPNHPHPLLFEPEPQSRRPDDREMGPEARLPSPTDLSRATAQRDAAVSRGCVSPAAADELLALFASESSALLTLSAMGGDGGANLAAAVFDTLGRHRPPMLGESTTVQLLTRLVPGQDDDRLELRDRMIALASGR